MGVRSITAEQFRQEVLEASRKQPVLVDFWAEWCAPCRMLAPVLDALAAEFADRLRIVKINVDKAPELAAQYQVRGIPNLKLFLNGNVVDELSGALPKEQIAAWLAPWLPSPADEEIERLCNRAASGALATEDALAAAESCLERHPDAHQARRKLVEWLLSVGECERARDHLRRLPANLRQDADLRRKLHQCELNVRSGDPDTLRSQLAERPNDPELRLRLADALAASEAFDEALATYLSVLEIDPEFDDGAARKGMLRIFELLGNRGELVDRYRKELARLLFR